MAYSIANWKDKNESILRIPPSVSDEEQNQLKFPANTLSSQETAAAIYETFLQSKAHESSVGNDNPSVLKSIISSLFGSSNVSTADELKGGLNKESFGTSPVSNESEGTCDIESLSVSVETESIPQQVHSMVRFHYASDHRFSNRIQFSRICPTTDDDNISSNAFPKVCGIFGVGMFADVVDGDMNIGLTSDRKGLLKYFSDYILKDKTQITKTLGLAHTRIASIGDHCRCVSWSFEYGLIRIYRRIQNVLQKSDYPISWQLIAIITPSSDLSSNNFNLVVTDLSPVMVDEDYAVLAVSRVGSLVQIIPIPDLCWKENVKVTSKNVMRLVAHGQSFPNGGCILVNHEVLSMDVFKKKDNNSTFGLATAGTYHQNGSTIVSFFAVVIDRQSRPSNPLIRIDFLSFVELSSVGTVLSTLVNDYERDDQPDTMKRTSPKTCPVSVINISPPILQILFSPTSCKSQDIEENLHLAVVDFHGGISIISCEALPQIFSVNATPISTDSVTMPYLKMDRSELNQLSSVKLKNMKKNLRNICVDNVVQIAWCLDEIGSSSTNISKMASLITVSRNGLIRIIDLFTKQGKPKDVFRYRPLFPSLKDETKEDINDVHGTVVLLHEIYVLRQPAPLINYAQIGGTIGFSTSERVPLSLCCIQKADPSSIVQHLMHKMKYEEGLNMAIQYDVPTDPCYKAIWEEEVHSKRHITGSESKPPLLPSDAKRLLSQIKDDDYVIGEALDIENVTSNNLCSCETLLVIFHEAFERAKRILPATHVGGDDTRELYSDSRRNTLMNRLNKLQTYIHLCSIWNIPCDTKFFLLIFISAPVLQLAEECSFAGKIDALMLLFTRHGDELVEKRLHLLELIPLTLSPNLYHILLPVPGSNIQDKESALFLLDDEENGTSKLLSFAGLISLFRKIHPSYFHYDDFCDLSTEPMSLESTNSKVSKENFLSTANWFIHKAYQIYSLTGNFSYTMDMCNFGIERLNKVDVDEKMIQSPEVKHAMDSLFSLRAVAFHISRCILDNIFPIEYNTIGISEFMAIGLENLVRVILGMDTDSFEVLSRYKRHVQPMTSGPFAISGLVTSEISKETEAQYNLLNNIDTELSDAVVSYGLKRVFSAKNDGKGFVDALSVCLIFANLSRTTLSPKIRVIKDIEVLMSFVLDCVYVDTTDIMNTIALKKYSEVLWELYECLPVRVSQVEDDEIRSKKHDSLDQMKSHLIAVDIASSYCMPPSLALMREEQNGREKNYAMLGCKLFSSICDGFCGKVFNAESSSQKKDLVVNFLSDTTELQKHVFPDLPVDVIMETRMISPLLYQHEFETVKDLLVFASSGYYDLRMDEKRTKSTILNFVRELYDQSITSDIDVTGLGQSFGFEAIKKCEYIFGSLYPDWKNDFQRESNLLDTLEYIRGLHCFIIDLSSLRHLKGLEVLELILSTNPASVLTNSDWGDAKYASKMTMELIQCLKSHDSPSIVCVEKYSKLKIDQYNLTIPGGDVLKLAKMLDVVSNVDIWFLKNRMIYHAMNASFYEVAACLCFALLTSPITKYELDSDMEYERHNELCLQLLRNIAKLVESKKFYNTTIKRELCSASLAWNQASFSSENGSKFLSVILKSFTSLELSGIFMERKSPKSLEPEIMNVDFENNEPIQNSKDLVSSQNSDFLVFKAAGMFAKRAKTIVEQVNKHQNIAGSMKLSSLQFPSYYDINATFLTSLNKELTSYRRLILNASYEQMSEEEFSLTSDAILTILARQVLLESVTQSAKVRYPLWLQNDRKQSIAPQAEVLKLMQFGVALLLHIQDEDYMETLTAELKDTLEEKSSLSLQLVSEETPATCVVPDEDIVKRLCAYGYELNGARRSALMTNNSSFNAALQWAIAHFQDSNFNLPVVSLKDSRSSEALRGGYVDQILMNTLWQALRLVTHIVEGDITLDKRMENIKHQKDDSLNANFEIKAMGFIDDTSMAEEKEGVLPIKTNQYKDQENTGQQNWKNEEKAAQQLLVAPVNHDGCINQTDQQDIIDQDERDVSEDEVESLSPPLSSPSPPISSSKYSEKESLKDTVDYDKSKKQNAPHARDITGDANKSLPPPPPPPLPSLTAPISDVKNTEQDPTKDSTDGNQIKLQNIAGYTVKSHPPPSPPPPLPAPISDIICTKEDSLKNKVKSYESFQSTTESDVSVTSSQSTKNIQRPNISMKPSLSLLAQRRLLREQNQKQEKHKLGTKRLGSEERKRLLEEGRRAFQEGRARRSSNFPSRLSSDSLVSKIRQKREQNTTQHYPKLDSATDSNEIPNEERDISELSQDISEKTQTENTDSKVIEDKTSSSSYPISEDKHDGSEVGDGWDFDDF